MRTKQNSYELARMAVQNLNTRDRMNLMAELQPSTPNAPGRNGPRVYDAEMVSALYGNKSKRLIFKLAREGFLERVKLPGRVRGMGFTAESVERLLQAGR